MDIVCEYCLLLNETVCIVEMRAYIVCLLSAGLFALHGLYVLSCIHVSLGSAGSLVCVCLVNSRWIYVPECVPVLSEGLFACLCVFCILVCPCPVALFVCVLFGFCFYSACSCVCGFYIIVLSV